MISDKGKFRDRPGHGIKRLLVFGREYVYNYQTGKCIGHSGLMITTTLDEVVNEIFEHEGPRTVHVKIDQITIPSSFDRKEYENLPDPMDDLEDGVWERWRKIEQEEKNK